MENATNAKRQLAHVCCEQKAEIANFRLFAANGNGKRKFVFLGRPTINGNGTAVSANVPICGYFRLLDCFSFLKGLFKLVTRKFPLIKNLYSGKKTENNRKKRFCIYRSSILTMYSTVQQG
jgi:hypothetical protein